MDCPLDYGLCCQTVTVYRRMGNKVLRQVLENAFYSYQDRYVGQAPDSRMERLFTLILPGNYPLQVGDRIYDGVGPELDPAEWAGFIPACVPGLSQVQYVKPFFWEGKICHLEAGRKVADR